MVTKYLNPKIDIIRLGLQSSKWTKAKGDIAYLLTHFGNKFLDCFPNWHNSQWKDEKLERLKTIFWNLNKLGWPKWLWRKVGDFVVMQAIGMAKRLRW